VNIDELNVYSLVSQGAELSEAERKVPSLAHALEKWFSRYPAELKDKYLAAHGKPPRGASPRGSNPD
jgi:hypothetical protein